MLLRARVRAFGLATLTVALAACAAGKDDRPRAPGAFTLAFEDALAPAAFQREANAVPDPASDVAGFWAVVPALPRPERARIENLDTGAMVEAALYGGRGGPRDPIRLSGAVAEALGVGPAGGRVRVTALRRKPKLAAP